jgi:DNA-binding GntR family transcriptional regulator
MEKETRTLNEDAYHKIKQMIFQKRVAPGQKLVYKDLCEILLMSPTPIINALNRLEQEGFLRSEAFRGFYVKPITVKEAWDLFGLREALETYAVEQAILRANQSDIETLEEKARNNEEYIPNFYDTKKITLNAEFHIQLAIMAGNQSVENLLRTNLEHVYLRFPLENSDPRRMHKAAREHMDLVEKIKQKDILGGVDIIRTHLRRIRDNIIGSLSKKDETILLAPSPLARMEIKDQI